MVLKVYRSIMILCFFCLCVVVSGTSTDNLIINSNFDSKDGKFITDWKYTAGNASISSKSIRIQDGSTNVVKLHNKTGKVRLGIATSADFSQIEPLQLTVQAKSPDGGKAFVYVVSRGKKKQWQTWSNSGEVTLGKDWQNINVKFYPIPQTASLEVVLASESGTVLYKEPVLRKVNVVKENTIGRRTQEFWINMDYYDEVLYCNNIGYKTYGEKEIAAFFKQCKKNNVTGVLWRISVLGQVTYKKTKVATVFPGRADISKLNEKQQLLSKILKAIDPLEIAVREAKKNGIKIMIWVTLSDEGYFYFKTPEVMTNNLVIDHPEYSLVDKKGKPMYGTLCYSVREARKYRLQMIKELLAYNADGIYLCTRTHSFVNNSDSGYQYGYNKPIVDEYMKRYGKNILKEDFDKEKWLEIRAEGLDVFIEQASKLVKAADQKLILGLKMLNKEELGWPYGKAKTHWKKWVKKQWVDSILAGHNMVSCNQILRDTQIFRDVADDSQKVYFWGQMVNYQKKCGILMDELKPGIIAAAFAGANGIMFHEAANFEELKNQDKYFPSIKELYKKLNSTLSK